MTYIVTQPAKDRERALADLADVIDAEHASPSRTAEDEEAVADIDTAQKLMLMHRPDDLFDAIKTATENNLIRGAADIARVNAEERKMRDEATSGKPTVSWGQGGLTEARTSMSVHLALERHPEFGPGWFKDDKKFEKFLRQFPDARTYNRRG